MEGSVMFIVLLFPVSPRHSTSPYLIAHAHDSFIMCVVIGALLIEYKNVNITYSKGYPWRATILQNTYCKIIGITTMLKLEQS